MRTRVGIIGAARPACCCPICSTARASTTSSWNSAPGNTSNSASAPASSNTARPRYCGPPGPENGWTARASVTRVWSSGSTAGRTASTSPPAPVGGQ